ncbi:MAG: penicillin-binding protein activator [Deltaproteobacteria bacterium]|nr:penicillin-binding protein activator [Deltaproteobacteria bacterium]
MTRMLSLLLALSLVASPALAGKRMVTPDLVEDALAYATTDRAKAIQLITEAADTYGATPEGPLLMLHAGEQLRLAGRPDEARLWFMKVLERSTDAPGTAASLGLALITAARNPDPNTWALLEDLPESDALATQNACRFLLLAERAAREDDASTVKKTSRKALSYGEEDPEVEARVVARLEALTARPPSTLGRPDHAVAGPQAPPTVGPGPAVVLPALGPAEAALAAGRPEDAKALAEQVLAGAPSQEDALEARYLIQRADAAPVIPGRVGVLLPTTGRFGAAAAQILEAIRLGLGDAPLELVVADTGEDEDSAVAALEDLALRQGVVAVIGPLRKEVADPVLAAANALRVPIVDLARVDGLTDGRDWAFQGMPTPTDEARALVSWLATEREMTRFAIFAPDSAYGKAASGAFTKAVEASGGQIVTAVYYDAEATDLIPFAKTLGRKDYTARAHEFYELKQAARDAHHDPSKVVLPPVIDFQGLFLPDSASRVPLATAALAMEEFPIGEFRTSKDGDTVPLIGLSSWNNTSLITAGNVYVRSSYFADAWFPDGPEAAAFVTSYREQVGRTPQALEVFAYDAAALLGAAGRVGAGDRGSFRDALLSAEVEGLASGATRFDPESRTGTYRFNILTIDNDAILTPAARAEKDAAAPQR